MINHAMKMDYKMIFKKAFKIPFLTNAVPDMFLMKEAASAQ